MNHGDSSTDSVVHNDTTRQTDDRQPREEGSRLRQGEESTDETNEPEESAKLTEQVVTGWKFTDALLEQVYDPSTEDVGFELYLPDSGEIRRYGAAGLSVPGSTIRFVPLADALISRRVVLLPVKSESFGSTEELVSEVREHIRRYVVLPEESDEIIAVHYVLFTYLFDRFETAPYLRFIGDLGTGKTRAVQVIGELCYKPLGGQGNASAASLYRTLDLLGGGTLLLDETDFNPRNEDHQEKMTLLRSGYQRYGSDVLKMDPTRDGGYRTRAFNVFGPKILAGRERFPDDALESRCIRIYMNSGVELRDVPHELTAEYQAQALRLRNKLLRWRQEHFFKPLRDIEKLNVDARLFQLYAPLARVIEDSDALRALRSTVLQLQGEMVEARRNSKEGRIAAGLLRLWSEMKGIGMKKIRVKAAAEEASKELVFAGSSGYLPRTVSTVLKGFGLHVHRDRDGAYVEFEPKALGLVLARYGLSDAV
jgi:hypothetical protein